MANLKDAIDYVLKSEDSQLTGKVTEDAGGKTRFGIAQRFHPDLTDENFYKADAGDALAKAEEIYAAEYEAPLHLEKITDQRVANKVLDFAVNTGVHNSAHRLQLAVIHCGQPVVVDNTVGPKTIAAVNAVEPVQLLKFLREVHKDYYNHVAATRGCTPAEYQSWMTRAAALGV
jgi:lysozyme family protein